MAIFHQFTELGLSGRTRAEVKSYGLKSGRTTGETATCFYAALFFLPFTAIAANIPSHQTHCSHSPLFRGRQSSLESIAWQCGQMMERGSRVSSTIRALPFYESTTSSKRQKEANCFGWDHGSAARLWSYVRAGLDAGCSIVEYDRSKFSSFNQR
jgi:hypothetical protein